MFHRGGVFIRFTRLRQKKRKLERKILLIASNRHPTPLSETVRRVNVRFRGGDFPLSLSMTIQHKVMWGLCPSPH